jgi:hypothetical protein
MADRRSRDGADARTGNLLFAECKRRFQATVG